RVSRAHARFDFDEQRGGWRLVDLNSKWGTSLNGTRLPAGTEVPLQPGDLIYIPPWTFRFTVAGAQGRRGGGGGDGAARDVDATLAAAATSVRVLRSDTSACALPERKLALLLQCAGAIHAARTEQQLAELVVDTAQRGSGLDNAVMLRPTDGQGHLEVLA